MGKVEVVGGKIKAPVYVETEGGDFKTFTALGKKLDQEFLAVQGDGLWSISNGMSVVFQTTDNEYGRIFFYKFLKFSIGNFMSVHPKTGNGNIDGWLFGRIGIRFVGAHRKLPTGYPDHSFR